jgi:uncharacterized protein YndB with AHSA1/START domain
MTKKIKKTILINASCADVWEHLINLELIEKWIGEPEMNIEIITDWKIGEPIIIKGFHHGEFENRGTILQFTPNKVLQYSHLSSISRLSDRLENYSIITFKLSPSKGQTSLDFIIENFPTESIFKHLEFYWNVTLGLIKLNVEEMKV